MALTRRVPVMFGASYPGDALESSFTKGIQESSIKKISPMRSLQGSLSKEGLSKKISPKNCDEITGSALKSLEEPGTVHFLEDS